jgi:hypothetical protein
MSANLTPRQQLEMFGFEESLRQAEAGAATQAERRRARERLEVAQRALLEPPEGDELAFLHAGLCQTYLPHSRLRSNRLMWRRSVGRLTLMVQPGVIDGTPADLRARQVTLEEQDAMYVGVPFGARARLILIHLQSEGVKSPVVPMGESLSAWIRSLGLPVSGGPRGSIASIREQALRIARCLFTIQFDDVDASGLARRSLRDIKIVNGLEMWLSPNGTGSWPTAVELNADFHEHLRQHAVPLDKRAISHLSDNSLGLDLYALFAHRLPRLKADLHLSWRQLVEQLGTTEQQQTSVAHRIRDIMPEIHAVYPEARVEVTRHGLLLKPSKPSVPSTMVNGFRLIEAKS